MRQKYKSLLGSPRTQYFKEAKSQPTKIRPQKVKFRKRYATSRLAKWAARLWSTTQSVLLGALLVGAIYQGRLFWKTSPWLKISSVHYQGDPPADLSPYFSIKPGQNILLLNTAQMEISALAKFKELKSISITRHFSRVVTVEVSYRVPLAIFEAAGKKFGVDESGTLFRLVETDSSVQKPPRLIGFLEGPELNQSMEALSTISRELPDFYSLIKILKTDRMQPLRMILQNDVVIYWGEMNNSSVIARAKKVLHVLQKFEPQKSPASLRFVTDDRLVLDSQWQTKI